ncbi:hypothetical protein D918_06959 [Trichuris suis]|nr:hypothetical protein D918_06959 [Trichuris suis]
MDIAYLADLYFKFNEMNKQLQSNELNLIKTKAVISAFLSKLMLFKRNFARGEFCQFPTLANVSKEAKILEDDVHIYCQHLEMLHEDFLRRRMKRPSPEWRGAMSTSGCAKKFHCVILTLWAAMKRLLIAIPSSSAVERGFGVVTDLVTKKPNRLEVVNRGDLRLRVTPVQPNIERIVGLHASCSSE